MSFIGPTKACNTTYIQIEYHAAILFNTHSPPHPANANETQLHLTAGQSPAPCGHHTQTLVSKAGEGQAYRLAVRDIALIALQPNRRRVCKRTHFYSWIGSSSITKCTYIVQKQTNKQTIKQNSCAPQNAERKSTVQCRAMCVCMNTNKQNPKTVHLLLHYAMRSIDILKQGASKQHFWKVRLLRTDTVFWIMAGSAVPFLQKGNWFRGCTKCFKL